jgi:hypothetical protein
MLVLPLLKETDFFQSAAVQQDTRMAPTAPVSSNVRRGVGLLMLPVVRMDLLLNNLLRLEVCRSVIARQFQPIHKRPL